MFVPPDDPRLTPVALRRELIAAGQSDASLARALRTGVYERPRRGAYVDGPLWRSMSAEQQYAVRGRAAYRQACTDVQISHTSALVLLDAPVWGLDLEDVHLTRTDGCAGRREAGIQQHSGALAEGDTITEHGTTFSSPLRATLEATVIGTVEAGLVVANHCLHRGDFTIGELRARYEQSIDHWPGSLTTDNIIRLADRRIETVGESRTFFFLWKQHFPRPIPQYEVFDGGVLIARLDFALPDQKVWIEFDGRIKYEGLRRPGESVTDVVLREKRREEIISEITGWRCLRVTWADLAHPERLAARLRRLIESVTQGR